MALLTSLGSTQKNNIQTIDNNMVKSSSIALETDSSLKDQLDFGELNDKKLLHYLENQVYENLVQTLNSDEYFVENVQAIYKSKEYLDEVEYNSKENIYFGYKLTDLEELFKGEKYIFTSGEDGKVSVQPFQKNEDVFQEVLTNVAVGAGTIVICITVSSLTTISAPAVSVIFAASAKSGATLALSNGLISAVASGIVKGIESKDLSKALEEAALIGSKEFKWGAITGVIAGGAISTMKLKGATLNGLTMNEAAEIQKESKFPLDVIKEFNTKKQYEVGKEAGLFTKMVNKKTALVRDIDLKYIDENNLTNLERMRKGLPALDPTGQPYELHHVGRKINSTLAILTKQEHIQNGNYKIWHPFDIITENPSIQGDWFSRKMSFWKGMAMIYQ